MSDLSAYNVTDPLTEDQVNEIDQLRADHPELLGMPYPIYFIDRIVISGVNATAFAHGWHWKSRFDRDLWILAVEAVTT